MTSPTPLQYEPRAGEHLNHAAEEAVKMAVAAQQTVTMQFNSVSLKIEPTMTGPQVAKEYDRQVKEAGEAYLKSPEYAAQQAEWKAQRQRNQVKMDALLGKLDGALKKGLSATVAWAGEYADLANEGADSQIKTVTKKLKDAGYKTNEYTDDKFVEGNKEIMGRYVLGQVLDFMDKGMVPHQVTSTFTARYAAMPDNGIKILKPVTFKNAKP